MYVLTGSADSKGALCSREINVKGSRFIAEVFYVENQSCAREKLHEVKDFYSDASHVVHAFITGPSGEIKGMSDDGEPSGTAGRPLLDVLSGSKITNILLTVTRYFGGTLLGTGGLVKAYGDSAKLVLSSCRCEELVARTSFLFSADYSIYESIKRFYSDYGISELKEDYGTFVKVSGKIREEEFLGFAERILNLSRGKIEVLKTDASPS